MPRARARGIAAGNVGEAIRDFRFVYSARRDVGLDQPPETPVLSAFSADIAQTFEKA
jgi:DNA-binding helix-hairpin-helix protein with protein kinase domain